jgi:hypothetical protein
MLKPNDQFSKHKIHLTRSIKKGSLFLVVKLLNLPKKGEPYDHVTKSNKLTKKSKH